MSVMLSAAGSLRWFRDALAPGCRFADAGGGGRRRRRPAATGSVFLPYLSGERSPHPDPLARGAFVGLTLSHDRRHLARAVLEGVAFGLRDGLDLMLAAGMPAPTQIRASGGGTASAAVAPDPCRRARRRDRHGRHLGGRGVRGRPAGGGRRRLVPERRRPQAGLVAASGRRRARARTQRRTPRRIGCTGTCTPRWRRIFPVPELRVRSGARRAPRSSASSGFLPRMIMASTSSVVTSPLVARCRRSGRGT